MMNNNIYEDVQVPRIFNKFFVVKADTAVSNLTEDEFEQFVSLMEKAAKGIEDHSYLVVNRDEPYADKVEKIILEGEKEKLKNGTL